MNSPKVSIVIPVYNGSDFLAEAIDSALAQTYENIEIVVVDDGSNDNGETLRIAQSYGEKVNLFSKPNGGVASALNRAISEMTGDYFSWLSHDDLYTADKVEKEIRAIESLKRADTIIYSDYAVFTDDPEQALAIRLQGVPCEQFRYWITVENQLHGCTLLIPRAAFDTVGRFDESLRTTQDYDLWYRMAARFPFVHLPDVLVKARSHAEQGSHKMAGIVLTECNALLSKFIVGLGSQEIIESTGKSLCDSYAEIASSMFRRGFDEAGSLARYYARQNGLPTDHEVTGMKNGSGLRDSLMHLGRTLLPTKVKHSIKAIIRPAMNKAAGDAVESPAALKEKFSEVYEKNIFGGRTSRSGEGSDLVQTEIIRRELPRIVEQYSVGTFLDAPCGDWYWMQETELGVEHYIGVDIVDSLIAKNNETFGRQGRQFLCVNLAEDSLPKADLIFSRDCLVHLNFNDALKIIANFKNSGAKYLLTTTFVDRKHNNDLVGVDDFWRTLNMCLPPFDFPEPLLVVNEGCTEDGGQYADKSLGLWLLNDIKI